MLIVPLQNKIFFPVLEVTLIPLSITYSPKTILFQINIFKKGTKCIKIYIYRSMDQ